MAPEPEAPIPAGAAEADAALGHAALVKEQLDARDRRPFWRRPAPWWQVVFFPLSLFAITVSLPAKLEAINTIACWDIRGADHSPGQLPCVSDPAVQANAASIIAVMTVLTGILNCCTATFWGALSDRRGRVFVERIYAFGPLLSDTLFIAVLLVPSFPGGRYVVIALGVIDGLFGVGTMTAPQAYIADTAAAGDTSRWFSLLMGFYYCGAGLGPLTSSLISQRFGLVPVFFTGIALHAVFLLIAFFLIPESLVPAQLEAARRKDVAESEEGSGGLLADLKGIALSVVGPLAVFLPSLKSFGVPAVRLPTRSYHLMFIALAYVLETLITGAGLYYLQYGMALFQWGATQLGYVISANQVAKASFLVFVLPLIIKYTRPAGTPPSATPQESQADHELAEDMPLIPRAPPHAHADHGLQWDIGLARTSLLLALASMLAMSSATTPLAFGASIVSVSLGAGFVPTVQSLALEFYRRRGGKEAGRLFGALNVVNSFGVQILGPSLMGILYASSVGSMPRLIFWAGAGILGASFALMLCVRPPPDYSEAAGDAAEAEG